MISLPEGINRDDVGQWLYGGICLARHHTTREFVPFVVDRVTENPGGLAGGVVGRYLDDEFQTAFFAPLTDLRAHWPLCGSVNVRGYKVAVHIERQPARQYKRTFNGRQLTFHLPRSWEIQRVHGANAVAELRTTTPAIVDAVFNVDYPGGVEGALAMLGDGWLSVAINPRVIIAGDDLGKRMIYYRGQLAATLTGGILSPVADPLTCRIINRALEGRYRWNCDLTP